jgi:hypothetical protein
MNRERLLAISSVAIPDSRFVLFREVSEYTSKRWVFFGQKETVITTRITPGIVQQKVDGTQIWDMYDPSRGGITSEWRPYLRAISDHLSPILKHDQVDYFDWNPNNFMFVREEERVYYIDSKPTTFTGAPGNQHNLKGIHMFFQL